MNKPTKHSNEQLHHELKPVIIHFFELDLKSIYFVAPDFARRRCANKGVDLLKLVLNISFGR
jgi:hypothetical protein